MGAITGSGVPGPSPAAGSEKTASRAGATAGSAGRSLLSCPAQGPEPSVDPRPLTLWILFKAIVGGGWRWPPGRGRGQGRDRGRGEGTRGRLGDRGSAEDRELGSAGQAGPTQGRGPLGS